MWSTSFLMRLRSPNPKGWKKGGERKQVEALHHVSLVENLKKGVAVFFRRPTEKNVREETHRRLVNGRPVQEKWWRHVQGNRCTRRDPSWLLHCSESTWRCTCERSPFDWETLCRRPKDLSDLTDGSLGLMNVIMNALRRLPTRIMEMSWKSCRVYLTPKLSVTTSEVLVLHMECG